MPHRGSSPFRSPKTRASASISAASPTGVPVPWASIRPDGARRDAGLGVGPPQRELLALHTRRHDAHGAAVARHADAPDHRVDAVAVPLGIGQPLEHDQADPLAEERAVGVAVERPDLLPARERAEPAEQVQRRHRHPHLRAAGERQVAFAGEQVAHRQLDGNQRGRARGVDGVRRSHQVEPVRDPADDDVRDQSRNSLGSERRQETLHLVAQRLDLRVGVLRLQTPDAGPASGRPRARAARRSRCRR